MKLYKILRATFELDLEKDVIKHLENGWRLQGGVSMAVDRGNGRHYVQAVTKTERKQDS